MTTTNQIDNTLEQDLDTLSQEHYATLVRGVLNKFVEGRPTVTLGEFVKVLAERNQVLHDALMRMQLGGFKTIFVAPAPEAKETKRTKAPKEPKLQLPSVEDWSKDEVKAAFANEAHAVIVAHGAGENGRGIKPLELREKLKRGSENQIRDTLKLLIQTSRVWSTGTTRGLSYIDISLKDQAQAKFQEEEKVRKEKAEKAPKK